MKIVVIGAGISGVTCVEGLFQDYENTRSHVNEIILLSDTRLIKRITNFTSTGRQLDSFVVTECTIEEFNPSLPGLEFTFIFGSVDHIDYENKKIIYFDHNGIKEDIHYDKLCLCVGSKPRQLDLLKTCKQNVVKDRVIVIKDTDTINNLQRKLKDCKSLVIIGNGGIGLELVSKIKCCDKTWIIRDDFMGCTYFDSGAAKFLHDSAISSNLTKNLSTPKPNRTIYTELNSETQIKTNFGPSLGPNWSHNLDLIGNNITSDSNLNIIYQDEVVEIFENNDQKINNLLKVVTKNGLIFYCDLVALAIGVEPNHVKIINGSLELSSTDGGILIDNEMRTSLNDIYAAGDVVSCQKWTDSELWFQMRLWTQARQMGHYAARCISCHVGGCDPRIYFNFDCFTHCTKFFGHRLVLLGRYNGQLLSSDKKYELVARVEPHKDYVKIIINEDGRIIGAVLIGESGLEETIENLIYDKIDVSLFKDKLLDNTIDIEDYFD